MSKTIDATKKACPIPFVLAKKEIEAGSSLFTLLVDNQVAIENLKRLATSYQFTVEIQNKTLPYEVTFSTTKKRRVLKHEEESLEKGTLLYLNSDQIGSKDPTLGKNLMRMFLYSLTQSPTTFSTIVALNGAVSLAVEDQQTVESLKTLVERGVTLLVCGTCLDFYNLSEDLAVGEVVNMYTITEALIAASKVVSV